MFTGIVQAQVTWSPRIQYIEVTLSYDAVGWAVSGTNILLLTQDNDTLPFSCTVAVPSGTSSTTIGELTVSGTWRNEPGVMSGDIEPAKAIINIDRFFSHELSPTEEYLMIEREDAGIARVNLRNLGNGNDSIRVDIINQDELSRYRIASSISDGAFDLEEGETKVIDIAISTSRTTVGTYSIEMGSVSLEAEKNDKISEPSSIVIEFMVVNERAPQEDPPDEEEIPDEEEDPPGEDDEAPVNESDTEKEYDPYIPASSSFGDNAIIYPLIAVAVLILLAIPAVLIIVVLRRRS